MKKIGIVGGLNVEATIQYYRYLTEEYHKINKQSTSPPLIIDSLNLIEIRRLIKNDQWDLIYTIVKKSINDLQKGGARIILLAMNIMHKIYDELQSTTNIPIISIMGVTAKEVQKNGLKRVFLLGTKKTMQSNYFQKVFNQYSIETYTPSLKNQKRIDTIIFDELDKKIMNDYSKKLILSIIEQNINDHQIEGIIIACNKLPLLLSQKDCHVACFNTMEIHSSAVLHFLD